MTIKIESVQPFTRIDYSAATSFDRLRITAGRGALYLQPVVTHKGVMERLIIVEWRLEQLQELLENLGYNNGFQPYMEFVDRPLFHDQIIVRIRRYSQGSKQSEAYVIPDCRIDGIQAMTALQVESLTTALSIG